MFQAKARSTRSIEEFLRDQKTHEEKRLSKQLGLIEKHMFYQSLELKEKPAISKRSRRIL